jgi:hypothetical protein
MSLYTPNESDMLVSYIDKLMEEANIAKRSKVRPTEKAQWDMINIVSDFVKEKKRKVYGGFALNMLIEDKDKSDVFYDECDIESWDIDFYSPEPIEDVREIADRLFKKGYKYVMAGEAQHEETYKVHAESLAVADISYIPKIIYNNMPFKTIKGFHLAGPHFMAIDYFRVMTDPLTSWHRLDKTFDRLTKMFKHYPLPTTTSSINSVDSDASFELAFNTIQECLENKKTTITIGSYAYNHLVNITKPIKIKQSRKMSREDKILNSVDFINVNFYEIISTNYTSDTKNIITKLKEKLGKAITYEENYPLFQFFGYSTNIMLDGDIICKIYHYNYRCTPYFDVDSLYFTDSKSVKKNDNKIRIGTVSVLMMYNLISILKTKIDRNMILKNTYYSMISNIIQMKKYYLSTNKKTIFDDTLFKEFIVDCIGDMDTPQMERQKRIDKKIKAKKMFSWRYNPETDKDKAKGEYYFKNTSGNTINNKRNLKIHFDKIDTKDIEVDLIKE